MFLSVDVRVCVTDVMFELTQTDKPNHHTHIHTHMHTYRGVCVCVFKIIRYAWQTPGRVVEMHVCNVCVSGGAAVCFPYFFGGGEKTARRASTISVLIYAATSSFHYAYN